MKFSPPQKGEKMINEFLLVASLVFAFGGVIVAFRFFSKGGIFAWIAICTILANVEVAVLVNAFGLEQTLGNTLFASTFLATDFLSEFYGKREARRGVFLGIIASLAFVFFSSIWRFYIPSSNDFAFVYMKGLFANTPRIVAASFIGFAVSEFIDIWLYDRWWSFSKKLCGNRRSFLWLRNNGSTLISQAVNITLFNVLAFAGLYDGATLFAITLSGYVIYVCTSLLDTPFIYLARFMWDKKISKEQENWIAGN